MCRHALNMRAHITYTCTPYTYTCKTSKQNHPNNKTTTVSLKNN